MRDIAGNEIHPGAILKVFHFYGSGKRKHFMYKKVNGIIERGRYKYYEISHLTDEGSYYIPVDQDTLENSVVVQCSCEFHIYNNLKRHKKFGA